MKIQIINSPPAGVPSLRGTAADLAAASIAPETRRAYAGALARLDDHLDGATLDDTALADYLSGLYSAGCHQRCGKKGDDREADAMSGLMLTASRAGLT